MAKTIIIRGRTGTGKSTIMYSLQQKSELNLKEIEIDKIKKFFKDQVTEPMTHFKIAGLIANDILEHQPKGGIANVIIEGAFDEEKKLVNFMNFVGRDLSDPNVIVIRLKCSLEKSIERKEKDNISKVEVEGQYQKSMVDIDGENIIETDTSTEQETLIETLKILEGKL